DWDADQMQEWLKEHPAKAEELTENKPSANAAGIESLLAGLIPPKGSDEGQQQRRKRMDKVRDFFDSLSIDDAGKLAMLFPQQTGNLNGVPFKSRTQANAVNVAAADHKLERKINRLEDELQDKYEGASRNNAHQMAN